MGIKIHTSDQTTAEPDDELYSLDSRILKIEITSVVLHVTQVVLLPKD